MIFNPMELQEFFGLIQRKKATIAVIVFVFLAITAVFTFIQPLKYGCDLELLVVQNSGGADAYSAAKSNEYISNILARVIYSNSFFNKALAGGFDIDRAYFSGSLKQRMSLWEKTLSARSLGDSGIISLTVYHPKKNQAEQIGRAIAQTLITQHALYHGNGDKVQVKIINDPVVSDWPVKPNIIFNFALGLVIGLIAGLSYILLFPDNRHDLRIMPHGEERNFEN